MNSSNMQKSKYMDGGSSSYSSYDNYNQNSQFQYSISNQFNLQQRSQEDNILLLNRKPPLQQANHKDSIFSIFETKSIDRSNTDYSVPVTSQIKAELRTQDLMSSQWKKQTQSVGPLTESISDFSTNQYRQNNDFSPVRKDQYVSQQSLNQSEYMSEIQKLMQRKETLLKSKGLANNNEIQYQSLMQPSYLRQSYNSFQDSANKYNQDIKNISIHDDYEPVNQQMQQQQYSPNTQSLGSPFMRNTQQNHQQTKADSSIDINDLTPNTLEERKQQCYDTSIDKKRQELSIVDEEDFSQIQTITETQQDDIILSVKDHLTNVQTLNFWVRYFSETCTNIAFENFFEAILQEYDISIIQDQVKKQDFKVNQRDLIDEFKNDLFRKLSVDQKRVSLNALELFTREKGIEKFIQDQVQEAIMRQKAQQDIQMNDVIINELMDVKKMLEIKAKQLAKKEEELKNKEKAIQTQKIQVSQIIKEELNQQISSWESKINKEYQNINKKVNQAERNIQNKIKLLQTSKSNELKQSQLKQSQLIQSQGQNNEKQLKARIQNIEKAYEQLKQKCQQLEEEKNKLLNDNKKLLDDAEKQKLLRKKAEKECQEKKQRVVLEEITELSNLNLKTNQSQKSVEQQQEPSKEDNKVQKLIKIQENNSQYYIQMIASILRTIQITIPVYIQNMKEEDLDFEASQISKFNKIDTITMGDLLFPSFNSIVPSYIEFVIPQLQQIPVIDQSILLSAFYSMIQFAFKTQIFEKKLPILLQRPQNKDIATLLNQPIKEDNLSKIFIEKNNKYEPYHLDFRIKNKLMKKRLQELAKDSKSTANLPLYQLFKDTVIHQFICEDLLQFLTNQPYEKAKGPQNKKLQSSQILKNKLIQSTSQDEEKGTSYQIGMKEQLIVNLLLVIFSQEARIVKSSLLQIKQILSNLQKAEDVTSLLLTDLQSVPFLILTLAFNEFTSISIAILLAMSFQQNFSSIFTTLMTDPITFDVFQYAMMQQRGNQIFEDFVIVLQKLSNNDPSSIRNLISTKLIEVMNEEMMKREKDQSQQSCFLVSNLKSILRNIQ